MRGLPTLLVLVAAVSSATPAARAARQLAPDASAPSAAATAPSPPSPTTTDTPEERLIRALVRGADTVVRARVLAAGVRSEWALDGVELEVLEVLHGVLEPRRLVLHDVAPALRARLRVGSAFYVVAANRQGASPARVPLALLDDTPAERARLVGVLAPAWQQTRIVVLARAVRPPTASLEFAERRVFEVLRVLRGRFPHRHLVLNEPRFAVFAPPAPGPDLYVLSMHDAVVPPGMQQPVPSVEDLRRVAPGDVPAIEAQIASSTPLADGLPARAAQLDAAGRVALWRSADRVAEVQLLAESLLVANCGTFRVTLTVVRSLVGSMAPGSQFAREVVNECHPGPYSLAGMAPLAPTLLAARAGTTTLSTEPSSPAGVSAVQSWLAAPTPWYAAQSSAPAAATPAAAGAEPLLVDARYEDLAAVQRGFGFVRFEVVERRDQRLASGALWTTLRCRRLPWDLSPAAAAVAQDESASLPNEWYFAGVGGSELNVGSRYFAPMLAPVQLRAQMGHGATPLGPVVLPRAVLPDAGRDGAVLLRYTMQRYGYIE